MAIHIWNLKYFFSIVANNQPENNFEAGKGLMFLDSESGFDGTRQEIV